MKNENGFIVGIGASAGGLEALEHFFDNMPPDSGLSFVIIQHLSPDYKSLMDEILSNHTRMKIYKARDGMAVEKNCIYLLPPKKNLKIFHRKLYLTDKKPHKNLNLPIDIFFRSLAEDQQEKSIGVILSGTGSDGTQGIKVIKEQGGMVMVQDRNTAQFDGMPRSAIVAGLVDFILPPEEMPDMLIKYSKNPLLSSEEERKKLIGDQEPMEKIFEMLKKYSSVDFSYYKRTTVNRRIEQRIGINQKKSIEEYLDFLQTSPNEVHILYKQLLIGVTRFFRDREAYDIINSRIIPDIFKNHKEEKAIRIWAPGCSTGEEAYSIALMFQNYIDKTKSDIDFKIFATDIDKEAIEFASQGIYSESISEDVQNEYLNKYFQRTGGFYQVNRQIREKIVFAPHNLIFDPPFNRISFLVCRNLLIYLQPILQKKVLSFFHYALKKNSYLFLGSSETVGELTSLFKTIDSRWKIYKLISRERKPNMYTDYFNFANMNRKKVPTNLKETSLDYKQEKPNPVSEIQKHILEKYMDPCIVLDTDYNIMMTYGNVNRYLQFPSGPVQYNVVKMLLPELSIPISTALHKVVKNGKKIIYPGIRIESSKKVDFVDLQVDLLTLKEEKYIIALFRQKDTKEKKEESAEKESRDYLDDKDQRINDLEQELQYTKENLQATIEELETSNEELQASNEELLSSNEELQTTNEELQSVNEELITVNSEYQAKIQELTDLNNDMENLLKNTDVGTIFLDLSLNIRKFTPSVKEIINLMEHDIGRPISHISHNLEGANIYEDSRQVLRTLIPVSAEVRNSDGRWYLKRIIPYRTTEENIKGVVITFVDITELKVASIEISRFSYAVDQSPVMIALMDENGRIDYANPRFLEKTGYNNEEILGKHITVLKPDDDEMEEVYSRMWGEVKNGEKWSGELLSRTKTGDRFWELAAFSKVVGENQSETFYLKIAEDITKTRKKQLAMEKEHKFLKQILENNPYAIFFLNLNGEITYANKKAEEVMKVSRHELTSRTFDDSDWEIKTENGKELPEKDLPFKQVIRTKEPVYNFRHDVVDGEGQSIHLNINATPQFGAHGEIIGVIASLEKKNSGESE